MLAWLPARRNVPDPTLNSPPTPEMAPPAVSVVPATSTVTVMVLVTVRGRFSALTPTVLLSERLASEIALPPTT